MTLPDRNIATAALLLTAVATQVSQARQHLTHELRLCDGLPTSTCGADNNGSRGERTVRVDEPCPGIVRCTWIECPDGGPHHDAHTHPCSREGEHTHSATVPVTIVEAAAIQRQHLQNTRNDLDAMTRGILTMANELANTCQKILGLRVAVPRCSATGRDGAIEWADPTCTAVPSRGSLCDRCSQREYRWRKLHGLPARTDGLFSGDPAA